MASSPDCDGVVQSVADKVDTNIDARGRNQNYGKNAKTVSPAPVDRTMGPSQELLERSQRKQPFLAIFIRDMGFSFP